jgi:hypothetical protein
MKQSILLLIALLCILEFAAAQDGTLDEYKRSSLYTIILDDHGLMDTAKARIIKETFFETPLPEKFNDHNLHIRTFNPTHIRVTESDILAVTGTQKKKKGSFGKILKSLAGDVTGGLVDTTDTRRLPAVFMKFFDENNISNLLLAKWYNAKEEYDSTMNSYFDMELIQKRGFYNASFFDQMMAEKSTRGLALLADAGEELIKQTFIIGIRFNYVNKEDIAKQASSLSSSIADMFGGQVAVVADAVVQAGASIAGRGYVIQATAYLFQLDWTEEANNKFYIDYYSINDLNDFYKCKDFKIKYIGEESRWADIQSTIFSKRTEEELVRRATVRAIDAVIAKLQKKYEPFRTKTPLLVSDDGKLSAKIGLKEGLEGGDKFEVMETIQNPESMTTTYKRVAVIKVDKKKIWDNRYAADEEREEKIAGGEKIVEGTIDATYFTGGNKHIYSGMLIRQMD